MAQIKRSIELDAPVEDVHEQWVRFEALPHCAAHSVTARTRWRAEVLTFQPLGPRTRVELKVEYDAASTDAGLPRRMEAVLRAFLAFFARARGSAFQPQPA